MDSHRGHERRRRVRIGGRRRESRHAARAVAEQRPGTFYCRTRERRLRRRGASWKARGKRRQARTWLACAVSALLAPARLFTRYPSRLHRPRQGTRPPAFISNFTFSLSFSSHLSRPRHGPDNGYSPRPHRGNPELNNSLAGRPPGSLRSRQRQVRGRRMGAPV